MRTIGLPSSSRSSGRTGLRPALAAGLLLLTAALPSPVLAQSGGGDPAGDDPACDQATTQGIVECLDGQTGDWDDALNAAYKAAIAEMDGDRAKSFRGVQRQWVQFRDENCGWYADGPGSIARIEASQCLHDMTKQRAQELQALGPN